MARFDMRRRPFLSCLAVTVLLAGPAAAQQPGADPENELLGLLEQTPRPIPALESSAIRYYGSVGGRLESRDGTALNRGGLDAELGVEAPISDRFSILPSIGLISFQRQTHNYNARHDVTLVPFQVVGRFHGAGANSFFLDAGAGLYFISYRLDPRVKAECENAHSVRGCSADARPTFGASLGFGMRSRINKDAEIEIGLRRRFVDPHIMVTLPTLFNSAPAKEETSIDLSGDSFFVGMRLRL